MWARVVEVMLGCWLAISPFIFNHPMEKSAWWINDLSSGFAVVALALLSFWDPMRHAHLAHVLVALWLIGFGYLAAPYPTPPALQNDLMLGLLLLMFAIIPNDASLPPKPWKEFYELEITREQGH
jgi:hypothetical protein